MSGSNPKEKGKYLYAIISGSENRTFDFCGIDEMPVYAISHGKVGAVVSDMVNAKIRPERRNLAAHQKVLKQLMELDTPLPMSFGIIADGLGGVSDILSNNQDGLIRQLDGVAGMMEMGLRVKWDVPNIFEYFIHIHPELRGARDQFFGAEQELKQEDKIELGRMFDRILNEDRESHSEKVEKALSPYCIEVKRNKCRNEKEVMNLAILVEKTKEREFDRAIFETATLFDNSFSFDYNGPWAPHNFVDIELEV